MQSDLHPLLRGFLDAAYVDVHGTTIRIGGRDRDPRQRAWITAWNPLGAARDGELNHAAQNELIAALDALGRTHFDGSAGSDDGTWLEPCRVVIDIPLDELDALALRFRQLAVVVALPGQCARLRCYRALWPQASAGSDPAPECVDWID